MKHLKSFNENFFKKTIDFFKTKKKEKTNFSELEEYDIDVEKIDNYTYKFYHNRLLVGRVFQPDGEEGTSSGSPVFKIFFYLYDNEIKNTKNWKIKNLDPDKDILEELNKQRIRPYYKLSKKDFSLNSLVQSFYENWATKTKSGRETTQRINRAKKGTTDLTKYR